MKKDHPKPHPHRVFDSSFSLQPSSLPSAYSHTDIFDGITPSDYGKPLVFGLSNWHCWLGTVELNFCDCKGLRTIAFSAVLAKGHFDRTHYLPIVSSQL